MGAKPKRERFYLTLGVMMAVHVLTLAVAVWFFALRTPPGGAATPAAPVTWLDPAVLQEDPELSRRIIEKTKRVLDEKSRKLPYAPENTDPKLDPPSELVLPVKPPPPPPPPKIEPKPKPEVKPKPKTRAKPKPKPKVTKKPAPKPAPRKKVVKKTTPKPKPKVRPTPKPTVAVAPAPKAKPAAAPAAVPKVRQVASQDAPGTATGAGGPPTDFSWYYNLIRETFYSRWDQPRDLLATTKVLVTRIRVRIEPNGAISSFSILDSSGNARMDQSVLDAGKNVSQIESLPRGISSGSYEVTVNFKLN